MRFKLMRFKYTILTTILIIIAVAFVTLNYSEIIEEMSAKVIEENNYEVEAIQFINQEGIWYSGAKELVSIDTGTEILIFRLSDLKYIKSSVLKTVANVKLLKKGRSVVTYHEVTIFVSESDLKDFSKQHAKTYMRTLNFSSEQEAAVESSKD